MGMREEEAIWLWPLWGKKKGMVSLLLGYTVGSSLVCVWGGGGLYSLPLPSDEVQATFVEGRGRARLARGNRICWERASGSLEKQARDRPEDVYVGFPALSAKPVCVRSCFPAPHL